MATRAQVTAAKRNIKKAAATARKERTISKLPPEVRKDMSRNAAAARRRGGKPGRDLEDRTRQQLYERAKQLGIPGRSRMGKRELIDAIRAA